MNNDAASTRHSTVSFSLTTQKNIPELCVKSFKGVDIEIPNNWIGQLLGAEAAILRHQTVTPALSGGVANNMNRHMAAAQAMMTGNAFNIAGPGVLAGTMLGNNARQQTNLTPFDAQPFRELLMLRLNP